ncbi:hypothetical protein KM043_001738 [Ampulex compressa]|nr:hypothetical protein KM043_001738 [Ampulex compressa]
MAAARRRVSAIPANAGGGRNLGFRVSDQKARARRIDQGRPSEAAGSPAVRIRDSEDGGRRPEDSGARRARNPRVLPVPTDFGLVRTAKGETRRRGGAAPSSAAVWPKERETRRAALSRLRDADATWRTAHSPSSSPSGTGSSLARLSAFPAAEESSAVYGGARSGPREPPSPSAARFHPAVSRDSAATAASPPRSSGRR